MPLRLVASSAAAALAGLLLAAAFEPIGVALLLPVGVAVWVLGVRGLSPRLAWLPGLVGGIAFFFVVLVWMRAIGTDAWIGLAGIEAAFFAPLGSLTSLLGRLRWWPVWTAALWVAVEDLRSHWPMSGMPWGRLSQGTSGTVWQEALPWIGSVGVSLLLALIGTTVAWLLAGGWRSWRTATLAAVALGAASLVPSLATGLLPVEEAGTFTVAIVQGNVPGGGTDLVAVHREVTDNHVRLTRQLALDVEAGRAPRPDAVIWPENSTAVDPFLDVGVASGIRAASDAVGVPILLGAMVDARDPRHVLNQGIVWVPGVGGADRYTKQHPVPFGEYIPWRDTVFPSTVGQLRLIPRDMLSGTDLEPLRLAGARVADVICFDVAYDDAVLEQVARGGQLLTVQTSNASFARTAQLDQQFEITRLRAIETGRWVAVASINGISAVVDPTGEVVASAPRRDEAVLVERVGLRDGVTPAVRMGLWPGRGVALVALVACAVALARYRRPDRAGSTQAGSTEEGHA